METTGSGMTYDLFSVDDHIIEHAKVWTDRLPSKYHDMGPHVVEEDGPGTGCGRASNPRKWASTPLPGNRVSSGRWSPHASAT